MEWKIGNVEIFQIVELEAGDVIQSVIKDATPENIKKIDWLYPHFVDETGKLKALVQSFIIKSDNHIILVDTCNGNDKTRTNIPEWSNLQTGFLNKLADSGISEKDIDIVVCTHLHCDHVGWNTKFESGAWTPTFPNAKYLFVREEYDYWVNKPDNELADDKASFDDSVYPIVKAGAAELVSTTHKIDGHVSFIPTSGHTPSHISVLIESQKQRAIISGDILHHPCQIANVEWKADGDTLPDKAMLSRQRILDEIADTDTLLIGSHFSNPVAGKVLRAKGGFVFKV